MTENVIRFHSITYLEDINIFKKNFNFPLDKIKNIKEYSFQISIRNGVTAQADNNTIFYINKNIDIKVIGESNSKQDEFAEFSIAYIFKFINEKDFVSSTKTSIKINEELSEWLDNVVLSTTRGIMYSEFRGTYFNEIIFPIILPKDLQVPEE